MAHALRSINPEAADRLDQGVDHGPVKPADPVEGWGAGIEGVESDDDAGGLIADTAEVDASPAFANDYFEIPPEPVADKPDLGPMPTLGSMVLVQLRPGDHRRGIRRFPSLVMGVDKEARTINATIIIEHNDVWSQERIPPCEGEEMGWLFSEEQYAAQRTAERLEILTRLVFGNNFIAADDPALYDRMSDLYDRIAKLEGRPLKASVPVASKDAVQPDAAPAGEPAAAPVTKQGRAKKSAAAPRRKRRRTS